VSGKTETIAKEDCERFLKQKPNKKMLGLFRFKLMLYNISRGGEGGKVSQWMATKTGEAPVILDSAVAFRAREQLETYLHARGYYNASVSLHLKKKNRRKIAKANYCIDIGTPYRIRYNMVNIEDSVLLGIVAKSMKQSLILEGNIFDIDMLKQEQDRITALIREEGYFKFSQKDLYFEADSTVGNRQADIYLHIPNRKQAGSEQPHRIFTVRKTYIIPDYDFKKAAESKQAYLASADTLPYSDSIFFLYHSKPYIKKRTIMRADYIGNGARYRTSDVDATQEKLAKNKLFKIVRIEFAEIDSLQTDSTGTLDCYIMLTPFTFQSYSIDLEGSSTDGDYGAKVKFSYNHKNLFRGAENVGINLTHSRKLIKSLDQSDNAINIFNAEEYSIDTKVETPHFISPFRFEKFQKNRSPNTILKAGYSYKHNLNYTSPQTYLSYGFSWHNKNKSIKYLLTPSEISGVRYFQMDSTFSEYINSNPYYRASYENYLITATNLTVIYSTRTKQKLHNYSFHKISAETAGNVLNSFIETTEGQIDDSELGLLQTKQTQYVKFDYDVRYYFVHSETNQTVFRLLGGVAYPYGARKTLPSIKQYYAGGLNSMRSWPSRTLGPGSYQGETDENSAESRFKYYLGDIRLEANAEHRFHMFWHLDGALFVDAGNIWTMHKDSEREGTQFEFSKFIDDIAIGAGLGLRFDFDFFVFRIDTGVKMRDPSVDKQKRWVIKDGIAYSDWNMNIGIGYPF